MKQQTFIAYIEDGNGKMMDFERFSCKRAETVRKNMTALFQNDLYRACTKGAVSFAIYATPDGYHREDEPSGRYTTDGEKIA